MMASEVLTPIAIIWKIVLKKSISLETQNPQLSILNFLIAISNVDSQIADFSLYRMTSPPKKRWTPARSSGFSMQKNIVIQRVKRPLYSYLGDSSDGGLENRVKEEHRRREEEHTADVGANLWIDWIYYEGYMVGYISCGTLYETLFPAYN